MWSHWFPKDGLMFSQQITNLSQLMMVAMSDTLAKGVSGNNDCVMLSYSLPFVGFQESSRKSRLDFVYRRFGSGFDWMKTCSVQFAKLVALTNACILATDCSATSYTDSWCCAWFWQHLVMLSVSDSCRFTYQTCLICVWPSVRVQATSTSASSQYHAHSKITG